MSVSNYIQDKKYLIKDLDNWIYLYQFNEPILNYITDDGTLNASASDIMGSGYEVYCENVSYVSNSSIDNRFSFEHTLTLTILDISTSLLNHFIMNKWMVLFKNKSGDIFILNAEYPIDVTYQYNINDENTPNSLTITLKSLSNTPIINYNENLKYTTLRDKPCGYNHSMIKRLRMLETTKGFISTSDNKIDVYMYHNTLKIIDVNPSSLSFTDSFDGSTYNQTLSFEIPLINHQFYFHYNILEYINNRYYCIIETTDGKYIVGGYKSGMFPSYTIEGNNIKITLTTNTTSNNTLIADYISFNEIEYNHCMGVDGECIDGLWTYKLIQRLELDGSVSNEYYALNGYENDYSDYNIVGTYGRFDTTFGIKLTNPLYDCFKKCYISGLPSFIKFDNINITKCYEIYSDCDFTYTYDITIIDVTFNEDTNEMCVTSLKMDSSTQIKVTTSDGIDRFVNVVIGTVGGEEGEYDRIYRWYFNGETYCLDENQQINCESAKTTTDTITSGACTYYRTELYISPLCDGKYDFYGYGLGDLISCERIYRWVVSDDESDYYCDYKTYTKYAMEVQEYSDDNGLTWIRTDNTRITDIVLEEYSEDCGYGADCGNDLLLLIYRSYGEKGTVRINLNDYDVPINNFSGLTTLTDLGVDIFTNANSMFKSDGTISKIISIPCTDYVTNMSFMFDDLFYLYKIDCITDLNTSSVTLMDRMFQGCASLTSLDLSSFDTSNVTYMHSMFSGCTNLTSLDLSSFDTSKVTDMSYMFDGCEKLTSLDDIKTFNTSNVNDMAFMFYNCNRLTSLDLSNWDTSNVIYMSSMFRGCESLTSLDLSNWDMSNVTGIDYYPNDVYFFTACGADVNFNNVKFNNVSASIFKNSGLRKINLTNADFTLVSSTARIFENCEATEIILNTNLFTNDIVSMFYNCINLKEVTFGTNFKTNNITSTFGLFSGCVSLKAFDVENLNTSNVTNMTQMFENCSGLTSLDLSPLDVSNVTNMKEMFKNCSGLTSLDLSDWDLTNLILDNSTFMFSGCENLRSIIMNNCNCTTISKIKNQLSVSLLDNQVTIYSNNTVCDGVVNGLPEEPSGSTSSNTDTITFKWDDDTYNPQFTINGKKYEAYVCCYYSTTLSDLGVTDFTNADFMFSNQSKITAITSIPDTSNVTSMSGMFRDCSGLTSLDIVKEFDTSNVTDMSNMFRYCNNLTSLDLSKFNTFNVTNMNDMFSTCTNLTSLDVSNFNTSNVTSMNSMFSSCENLTSLDVSNFNTSNVTDMRYMFSACGNLKSLDLSNFDTSNVTSMSGMFSGSYNLGYTSCLDLSNFDTSNVTSMSNMFNGCRGLLSINLSGWDTSKVTNMSYMFYHCSGLTSLDLSSLDVSNVTDMDYMLYQCENLIYLDLSNWDLSSINELPYSMFEYSGKIAEIKVENCSNETIEKLMKRLKTKGAKYDNNIIYF